MARAFSGNRFARKEGGVFPLYSSSEGRCLGCVFVAVILLLFSLSYVDYGGVFGCSGGRKRSSSRPTAIVGEGAVEPSRCAEPLVSKQMQQTIDNCKGRSLPRSVYKALLHIPVGGQDVAPHRSSHASAAPRRRLLQLRRLAGSCSAPVGRHSPSTTPASKPAAQRRPLAELDKGKTCRRQSRCRPPPLLRAPYTHHRAARR